MFNIGDFLIKFKNLTPPDQIVKNIFLNIIYKKLDIKIPKKNISLKNNTLYLKINPIIKNEIFLHKESILKELKKELKEKTPKNFI